MMPLDTPSPRVAGRGLAEDGKEVQLRISTEPAASSVDEDPYRRQLPVFKNELDRVTGVSAVHVKSIVKDTSDFREQYMPGHPAADERGYVKMPNVNSLVEMMDMREAQRAYEANLSVIDNSRAMMARTLDLLKR